TLFRSTARVGSASSFDSLPLIRTAPAFELALLPMWNPWYQPYRLRPSEMRSRQTPPGSPPPANAADGSGPLQPREPRQAPAPVPLQQPAPAQPPPAQPPPAQPAPAPAQPAPAQPAPAQPAPAQPAPAQPAPAQPAPAQPQPAEPAPAPATPPGQDAAAEATPSEAPGDTAPAAAAPAEAPADQLPSADPELEPMPDEDPGAAEVTPYESDDMDTVTVTIDRREKDI